MTRRKMCLLIGIVAFAGILPLYAQKEKAPYVFRMAFGPYEAAQGAMDVKDQLTDPYFQSIAKKIGVVPTVESWPWNGGTGYVQSLRLALASGQKFDAIRPWDMGLTVELIKAGQALALDSYLDKEGKDIKAMFTKEQWDQVRAIGKGKIYFIPAFGRADTYRAAMIRKDWLDRLGLKVPTTQAELLTVLRAFKTQDADGDGIANNQIPVSGREMLRWFDDLFVMHGVSMYEGHPQWKWNPSKKIFESSQVSSDMKDAIMFMRQLYGEGLMDQVMPTQKSADWNAKINSGKVGMYFHLMSANTDFSNFRLSDPSPDASGLKYWTVMPLPALVPGKPQYKNIFPILQEPNLMILKNAKDPAAIVRWYNYGVSLDGNLAGTLGIEGTDWKKVNGKIEVIKAVAPNFKYILPGNYDPDLLKMTPMGEVKVKMVQDIQKAGGVQELQSYLMPPAVYKGYEDYAPGVAKLYREKVTKFIISDTFTNEEWDAYVKDWYAKGGQVVTNRATAWYKDLFGVK